MTEWLSDAELRAWIGYMDLSALLDDYLDRQLKRDARMSHASYALLNHLSAAPNQSMRMTDLAERLKITRGRLSHNLANLEEHGWIARRTDPGDKRGQVAVLTDAGTAALAAAAPGHVAAVRRAVFDQLTPEQVRQFTEITQAITASLTGEAEDPGDLPWRRRLNRSERRDAARGRPKGRRCATTHTAGLGANNHGLPPTSSHYRQIRAVQGHVQRHQATHRDHPTVPSK